MMIHGHARVPLFQALNNPTLLAELRARHGVKLGINRRRRRRAAAKIKRRAK